MRKSHIMQAFISMYLIRTRITKEGEIIPANIQGMQTNFYHFNIIIIIIISLRAKPFIDYVIIYDSIIVYDRLS
jgi:hypothetical protein